MRYEQELKEREKCTFKPNLSMNSRINECSVLSKYNGNVNIFDRLYQTETKESRYQREDAINQEKQLTELSECTFKPNVNKQRVSTIRDQIDAKNFVNDFEKSVGRLKTGYTKAQIIK